MMMSGPHDDTAATSLVSDVAQDITMWRDAQQYLLKTLDPDQRAAVISDGHIGLRLVAGAGAGKTRVLVHRYCYWLLEAICQGIRRSQEAPAHQLMITFTNKAALEMRERLEATFADLGLSDAGAVLPEWGVGTCHMFAKALLREALPERSGGWLTVSDTHQVGDQVLTIQSRVPAPTRTFRVMDEVAKQEQLRDLIDEIRTHRVASWGPDILAAYDLLDIIPADMFSVDWCRRWLVEWPLESILSVIPALMAMVKSMGLPPRAFYTTFAAQVHQWHDVLDTLPDRCRLTGEPIAEDVELMSHWMEALSDWVSPWLKDCLDCGEEDEPLLGKRLSARELQKKWVGLFGSRLLVDLEMVKVGRASVPRYFPLDPQARERALQAKRRGHLAMLQAITAFYALYQYRLAEQSLCDFDDWISLAAFVLEDNEPLRKTWQERLSLILVDEFQDTNGAQIRLLRQLVTPQHCPLTVVGDIRQSIYSFRYAQPENLDQIFEGMPYVSLSLQRNYRSAPAVVHAANALMTPFEYPEMVPMLVDKHQADLLAHLIPTQNLKIEDQIVFERQVIVSRIQTLLSHGVPPQDIAVLVLNNDKAVLLEKHLKTLGIPAYLHKPKGTLLAPIVQRVMAVLRLLEDPDALPRLVDWRLLLTQLSDATWWSDVMMQTLPPGTPMTQALGRLVDRDTSVAEALQSFLAHRQAFLGQEAPEEVSPKLPSPATRHFVEGLDVMTRLFDCFHDLSQEEALILRAFYKLVHSQWREVLQDYPRVGFANDEPPLWVWRRRLGRLIERLSLSMAAGDEQVLALDDAWEDTEALSPSEPGVVLMTAHGSKGLEFPHVILPWVRHPTTGGGAQDPRVILAPRPGNIPGFGLIMKAWGGVTTPGYDVWRRGWKSLEEECELVRLFYVALTRAKSSLQVICNDKAPVWMRHLVTNITPCRDATWQVVILPPEALETATPLVADKTTAAVL